MTVIKEYTNKMKETIDKRNINRQIEFNYKGSVIRNKQKNFMLTSVRYRHGDFLTPIP